MGGYCCAETKDEDYEVVVEETRRTIISTPGNAPQNSNSGGVRNSTISERRSRSRHQSGGMRNSSVLDKKSSKGGDHPGPISGTRNSSRSDRQRSSIPRAERREEKTDTVMKVSIKRTERNRTSIVSVPAPANNRSSQKKNSPQAGTADVKHQLSNSKPPFLNRSFDTDEVKHSLKNSSLNRENARIKQVPSSQTKEVLNSQTKEVQGFDQGSGASPIRDSKISNAVQSSAWGSDRLGVNAIRDSEMSSEAMDCKPNSELIGFRKEGEIQNGIRNSKRSPEESTEIACDQDKIEPQEKVESRLLAKGKKTKASIGNMLLRKEGELSYEFERPLNAAEIAKINAEKRKKHAALKKNRKKSKIGSKRIRSLQQSLTLEFERFDGFVKKDEQTKQELEYLTKMFDKKNQNSEKSVTETEK